MTVPALPSTSRYCPTSPQVDLRRSAKAFHATDFYPSGGEFRRGDANRTALYQRHSKLIPLVIGKYVRQLFVVSFLKDEFDRVAPEAWRSRFGGVHRVAAQMALTSIGYWAQRTGCEEEIAYFYERGDDEDASVRDAFVKVFVNAKLREHARMAATPFGLKKGKARGLEVADFLAWHWNKYFADSRGRFPPRPLRKDIRSLMEHLQIRDKSKIDVRLIAGKSLEDFLVDQGCQVTARPVPPASA